MTQQSPLSALWDLSLGTILFLAVLAVWRGSISLAVAPWRSADADLSGELIVSSAVAGAVAWSAVALKRGPLRYRVTATICLTLCAVLLLDRAWTHLVHPAYSAMGALGILAARLPLLTFSGEVIPPAVVSSIVGWVSLRSHRTRDLVLLMVAAVIAAVVGALLYAPATVRGYLEAARVLQLASANHLSGVHVSPALVHFWISLATVTPVGIYAMTLPKKVEARP